MCLIITKYFFVAISILLSALFLIRMFLPDLFKDSKINSPFMAFLGGLVIFYVLSGLAITVFMPAIIYKIIMLLFTLSPFIIGKIVTYQKLRIYSIIQILCVILSIVFVILV